MHPHARHNALVAIVRDQHGLATTEQLLGAGLSPSAIRRQVEAGVLERLEPGLFRLAGTEPTWRQRAMGATLSHGPGALLSHRAAAMLWQLDGFDRAPLEVTVPRWKRTARHNGIVLHESKDLAGTDRTTVESIPVTTVVRTLIDLPAVASAQRADQAFEDALRRRLCTVPDVANRFVQVARRGRNGTRVGRLLIEKRFGESVPTHSEFERRMCDALISSGIPRPERQIAVPLGEQTAYIDLGWRDLLLGIECDGLMHHASNVRLPWDERRQNELQLRGWLILRFTWAQLASEQHRVIDQVRTARLLRGRASA